MQLEQKWLNPKCYTNEDEFMRYWNNSLDEDFSDMTIEQFEQKYKKVLESTSPQHPNPNMVWLHDRVLFLLATKEQTNEPRD